MTVASTAGRRVDLSPVGPLLLIWRHRFLISRLARREIEQRYRGSVLGILWSLLTPLLLLLVYTFAFSVVFRARWTEQPESHVAFALVLFAGLIVFGCFGEVLNRAPGLVLGQVSYVKKVVFPTEVLVPVLLAGAFFQLAINTAVLLAALLVIRAELAWTVVLFPVVLLPLVLLLLGLGWVLAALGCSSEISGSSPVWWSPLSMFLVPLFYPLAAVPPGFRDLIAWNPLAYLIEEDAAHSALGRAARCAGPRRLCAAGLVGGLVRLSRLHEGAARLCGRAVSGRDAASAGSGR